MELEQVRLQTTWNDAAGSINSNYAKIADAIAQLKTNGGGGGGGADTIVWSKVTDKPAWIIQAGNSKPKYSYDELTDTPDLSELATKTYVDKAIDGIDLSPYLKTEDAEETYATKDFVDNKLVNYAPLTSVQGFENRIGGLEGAVPKLNERVTTVEGKVSTLNETVSTGENNLLDRVNTIETDYVTSGNLESAINGIDLSVYLLKADLTKSRIQSTLGISDWALAATKPTYTASEVGALATSGGSISSDDYQPLVVNSNYYNYSSGVEDVRIAISHNGKLKGLFNWENNGVGLRMYNASGGGSIGIKDDGTPYYNNRELIHLGNYSKYALPIKGGTLKGNLTAPKFIGSLQGNADSATKLQTPQTLWGQSFDGTKNISGDINNAAGGIYIHKTHEINSFNGKLYLNRWGSGLTGYGSTNHIVMVANGGNVGIGNSSPTERLDVSGNIKADGNINATSITINGVTITASNGSITVNGNVLATGSITAKKKSA